MNSLTYPVMAELQFLLKHLKVGGGGLYIPYDKLTSCSSWWVEVDSPLESLFLASKIGLIPRAAILKL